MSSRSVTLQAKGIGGQQVAMGVDSLQALLGTADAEEIAIAQGVYFAAGFFKEDVATGESLTFLFRSGPDIIGTKLGIQVDCGGSILLTAFEFPTLNNDGTIHPRMLNVNRLFKNKGPNSTLFLEPDIANKGDPIAVIPSARGVLNVGSTAELDRLVTEPATDYIVQVFMTQLGPTQPLSVILTWIEIPTPGVPL